ncbi:MAG: porphobilinogen synthase [Alphaproteobacteria bacterium]
MAARPHSPSFPQTRMRRNRQYEWSRRLIREHVVTADDLIWPVFVQEGDNTKTPIATMPGVYRYTVDLLTDAVGQAKDLGIPAIALFPVVPAHRKTPTAQEAYNPDNLVCRAIRTVRRNHPDIGIISDVALDPFNSDGHDGIVQGDTVANDETLIALCKQALVQAQAGCHVIAPSDMMDGRIGAIRNALDEAGDQDTLIMAYAAKFASAFYGPFRDALDSAGSLKGASKATYQLDPANGDEAIREVALDIAEGADIVMVKPGLPYLDILYRVKQRFGMPTYAYNVSGEYAMLAFAAQAGALDRDKAMMEMLTSFKRAGADAILTYFAIDAARLLRNAS